MKPVLVVCRAETINHAPEWLCATGYNYRGIVSQYGNDASPLHHTLPGGKWVGIYDLFRHNPELLDKHDYFWFPDDDIETTPEDIHLFLDISQGRGFELAQPALTPQSVYAYRLTVSNPKFEYRLTNFVELMMPLMHKKLLFKILPIIANKHAALGLDWFWHNLVSIPTEQVAIIDRIAMGHYRTRNVHLVSKMRSNSVDLVKEKEETFEELNIKPYNKFVYGGCLISGQEVSGLDARVKVAQGYFSIRKNIKQTRWKLKNYIAFLFARK